MTRIQMTRNAFVAGSAYSAGQLVLVSTPVAEQLIAMQKAVAVADAPPPDVAPHLTGIEHAIDRNVMTAERRNAATNWGDALVTDIDGIGPVTAELLAEAGIETMAELLAADAPTLAHLARVSPAKAEKWRQRAQAVASTSSATGGEP